MKPVSVHQFRPSSLRAFRTGARSDLRCVLHCEAKPAWLVDGVAVPGRSVPAFLQALRQVGLAMRLC